MHPSACAFAVSSRGGKQLQTPQSQWPVLLPGRPGGKGGRSGGARGGSVLVPSCLSRGLGRRGQSRPPWQRESGSEQPGAQRAQRGRRKARGCTCPCNPAPGVQLPPLCCWKVGDGGLGRPRQGRRELGHPGHRVPPPTPRGEKTTGPCRCMWVWGGCAHGDARTPGRLRLSWRLCPRRCKDLEAGGEGGASQEPAIVPGDTAAEAAESWGCPRLRKAGGARGCGRLAGHEAAEGWRGHEHGVTRTHPRSPPLLGEAVDCVGDTEAGPSSRLHPHFPDGEPGAGPAAP